MHFCSPVQHDKPILCLSLPFVCPPLNLSTTDIVHECVHHQPCTVRTALLAHLGPGHKLANDPEAQ